jgi:catechol 2,3-dioxygenase-like lactoylglutathione lyase family enzyme
MPTSSSRAPLGGVSPLFIVGDLHTSIAFYRDALGFAVTLLLPEQDPFFGIVRRDGAELLLKAIGEGVSPLPNPERHANARWDAYVEAPDPDGLAAELAGRGVIFCGPLQDWDDGVRGFELRDRDGYVLFFGRPLAPDRANAPRLVAVHPVLMVRDVTRALEFYARLGFRLVFRDDTEHPRYAGVRRDEAELHLQWHAESAWQHSGDRPTYRVVVDDPDGLSQELEAIPGLDRTPVSATAWGTREFHVRDPDGNGLQFYRDL